MSITNFFKPKEAAAKKKSPDEPADDNAGGKRPKIASPAKLKVADAADAAAGVPPSLDTLESFIPADWLTVLESETSKAYWRKLKSLLLAEVSAGKKHFPPLPHIFNALQLCHWKECRVVILGQDPYHDVGQGTLACNHVPA
jgi:hypothetical protein